MIRRFLFHKTRRLISAALGVALFVLPSSLIAGEISLTSANGGLILTGRYIGFDGTYLQLESKYGPLTVRYGDMVCEGADCPDANNFVPTIRLSGASRMARVLLPGLIEGFGRSAGYQVNFAQVDEAHAELTLADEDSKVAVFSVRGSSTDEGFADLISHETDIVMSVREVRDAEIKIADEIGIGRLDDGRQSRIVALDALVPVVDPGHPMSEISLRDLSRVYRGVIKDWADVGGDAGPISLHLLAAKTGLTQGFVDDVVAVGGVGLSDDVTFHATLDDLIANVVGDETAIGMVSWTKAAFAQQLALTDQCGFTLVPRPEMLKAEDYPLTMPLFLYLPKRSQAPVVGDFLKWLRTPEAQLVVRRSGFVDAGAVPIALSDQGQRFASAIALAGPEVPLSELQRMVDVMKPRTRLSTSFRFEAGSTRLDAQSRSGLLDLAQSIRDGHYAGRSLTLIGFSDGRGEAIANKSLSNERAQSVARALTDLLREIPEDVSIMTDAFGEALPMGCDDTTWGRQMNRRVELWVD